MKKSITVNLEIEPSQKKNGIYINDAVKDDSADSNEESGLQMDGPDGFWAWCVALAACSITFIIAGLARISGIMYVAYIDVFNVNRQVAAYPSAIRASTKNLLGPVVGILGQQYGVRSVTLAGGVIASLSAAACYFATSIDFVVIVWGGINGIGCALTVTLIQVITGQHFKKYRSTASGLSFSGGCVGSFVFPVLIEYLIHQFGLQGTFLILSAIIMHIIPAAMILRKPIWLKSSRKRKPSNSEESKSQEVSQPAEKTDPNQTDDDISNEDVSLDSGIDTENAHTDKDRRAHRDPFYYWHHYDKLLVVETVSSVIDADIEMKKISEDINSSLSDSNKGPIPAWIVAMVDEIYGVKSGIPKTDIDEATRNHTNNLVGQEEMESKLKALLLTKMSNITDVETLVDGLQKRRQLSENHAREIVAELSEVCKIKLKKQGLLESEKPDSVKVVIEPNECKTEKNLTTDLADLKNFVPKKIQLPIVKKDGFREHLKTAMRLPSNPFFILVCLSRVVHFVTFVPFVTVLVDYGIDKGLPEDDGKYIIAALSAGDLIGRIGLGWVTDRNCCSLPRFMLCAMVTQGFLTASLPLVQERNVLLITVSLFGMFVGATFVRHPVLLLKYLDRKEQSIAVGCITFVPGVIGFGLPTFIGYFRDNLGSYDKMFFITGSVGVGVGLLWLLEPQLAKFAPKRTDELDDQGDAIIPTE